MILSYIRILFLALVGLLTPVVIKAAVPTWQIVLNESRITFTGIQNNAPISGEFKNFTGEIHFDPTQSNASKVYMVVDMNSVSTAFSDMTDTLKSADWFDVKRFSQAVFKSTSFTKIGDNTYQANGDLTIRDKTLPLTLTFVAEEYSKTKARVKGSFTLKRTQFGVGQGEWASTNEIKDDVRVDFTLTAVRK